MGLSLEEADASIQLRGHGDGLVICEEGAYEGGIVGADLGDVGVFPAAEFWVAVAGGLSAGW